MPSTSEQLDQRSGGGSRGSRGCRALDGHGLVLLGPAWRRRRFLTGVHLSISAWMNWVTSARVMMLASAPISSQRLTTAGSFSAACIALANRSTIGWGVLAGTEMPNRE